MRTITQAEIYAHQWEREYTVKWWWRVQSSDVLFLLVWLFSCNVATCQYLRGQRTALLYRSYLARLISTNTSVQFISSSSNLLNDLLKQWNFLAVLLFSVFSKKVPFLAFCALNSWYFLIPCYRQVIRSRLGGGRASVPPYKATGDTAKGRSRSSPQEGATFPTLWPMLWLPSSRRLWGLYQLPRQA